jgi:hypothetical protein
MPVAAKLLSHNNSSNYPKPKMPVSLLIQFSQLLSEFPPHRLVLGLMKVVEPPPVCPYTALIVTTDYPSDLPNLFTQSRACQAKRCNDKRM